MNVKEFTEHLINLIEAGADDEFIYTIGSFEEEGVVTKNEGLVLRLTDGSEYQITVVKSINEIPNTSIPNPFK